MAGLTAFDTLSNAEIQAANPEGIPLAVNMPGSAPYVISGAEIGTGSSGNVVTTGGGSAVPNTAAANPLANATPSGGTATASPNAPTAGSLADYFARAIIIILGFIFVAIGLNMLRPGTVPLPRMR
jgi:hypothetical protein